MRNSISFRGLLLAAAIFAATLPAAAQVKVWQGTMTLPTFKEGPPDPNPPFDLYAAYRGRLCSRDRRMARI